MTGKARIAVVGAGWWATEYHIPFLIYGVPNGEVGGTPGVGVSETGSGERRRVFDRKISGYQCGYRTLK